MYKLNEQIEENIKELQYVLKQMESFDKNAPEGSLRISKSKGGNERYYHRLKDQKTGTITQRYISKKQEMLLIRQLAQKTYQDSLKPILEKEIAVLEKLKREYDSNIHLLEKIRCNKYEINKFSFFIETYRKNTFP